MPESSYPGSPSLSAEAREKVLQTFRHTIELASGGRNEEALLGCDFILKMDTRFQPARKLLETLRGVAAGTVLDLSAFSEFVEQAPAAPSAPPPPAFGPGAGTVAIPAFSLPPTPGGAVDLGFGTGADPFAAPPVTLSGAPAVKPPGGKPVPKGPPPPPAFADPFAAGDPFAMPEAPVSLPSGAPAQITSFGGAPADPFAAPAGDFGFGAPPAPPAPAFGDPFAASAAPAFAAPEPAFGGDPFAAPSAPAGDFGFGAPPAPAPSFADPFAAPAPDFAAPAPSFGADPFAASAGAPAFAAPPAPDLGSGFGAPPSFGDPFAAPGASAAPPPSMAGGASVDPRITQFLKQGDEAMGRGAVQEAIDLWSRVFLIDLSNDEASRRIDSARERQAENVRQVDTLLQEGIHRFEQGDLAGSKQKFLEVLALNEHDATAKGYLQQIEGSRMPEAPPDMRGASDDFMKSELEAPPPSFAEAEDGGAEALAPAEGEPGARAPRERPVKSKGVDVRLVAAAGVGLLVVVAAAAFFLMRDKPSAPPVSPTTSSQPAVSAEALVGQAEQLVTQGNCEEALKLLADVPVSDPIHDKAMVLIDRCRSQAPGVPDKPAMTPEQVAQVRELGMAAFADHKYIEAVQNLDQVVKINPSDTEAADNLARARERVAALGSALRAFNEGDHETAIKLLWDLKKQDKGNQDVDEFLFKSYFNSGIQNLQAGSMPKAVQDFQEASALRPKDEEAQRHLKFARKYKDGARDLLSRIYVKHVSPRS